MERIRNFVGIRKMHVLCTCLSKLSMYVFVKKKKKTQSFIYNRYRKIIFKFVCTNLWKKRISNFKVFKKNYEKKEEEEVISSFKYEFLKGKKKRVFCYIIAISWYLQSC